VAKLIEKIIIGMKIEIENKRIKLRLYENSKKSIQLIINIQIIGKIQNH